jgi:hypothetical protein
MVEATSRYARARFACSVVVASFNAHAILPCQALVHAIFSECAWLMRAESSVVLHVCAVLLCLSAPYHSVGSSHIFLCMLLSAWFCAPFILFLCVPFILSCAFGHSKLMMFRRHRQLTTDIKHPHECFTCGICTMLNVGRFANKFFWF